MHHEMPGMRPPREKFKQIDRADFAYPCSILADRYQESCWVNQVSVIEYFVDWNVVKASDACEKAPAKYVHHCFVGLGTDLNGQTLGRDDSTLALCAQTSIRGQPWCYVGAAKNIVEVGAEYQKGLAFCRRVPGSVANMRCYEGIGEEIASISAARDRPRPHVRGERGGLSERLPLRRAAVARTAAGAPAGSLGTDDAGACAIARPRAGLRGRVPDQVPQYRHS